MGEVPSVTVPYIVVARDGNRRELQIDVGLLSALNLKFLAILQAEQILFDVRHGKTSYRSYGV